MIPRFPRQIDLPLELMVFLAEAAVAGARASLAKWPARMPCGMGETLKPGRDTPLWNSLAAAVTGELRRRGERARLARVLELPRQRVTEMLRQRRYLPDAERTLMLLLWLQARRSHRDRSPYRGPALRPTTRTSSRIT
jgi:hypothetical protein